MLDRAQMLPLEPGLLETYAEIDAWLEGKIPGPAGEPPWKPARNLGKNEIWLAATARVTGATLVTTDRDFEPRRGVWIDLVVLPLP